MLPNYNNPKKAKYRSTKNLKYSSKDYVNPYFRKRAKKSRQIRWPSFSLGWKARLSLYGGAVVAVALLIWLFGTAFFHVRQIEVNGGGRISTEEVEKIAMQQTRQKRWLLLPQKHILFYDKADLADTLSKKYAFDELLIDKKLPGKIILNYSEKSYALIWQEESGYFYTDNTGLKLDEANLLEIGERDYPIIDNVSNARSLGNRILAGQEYINQVLEIFGRMKDYEDMHIARFLFDNSENSIKFKLAEGPEVYVNMNDDLGRQLEKLSVIKNEKIKDDFSGKQYIDVRYGDSVYYR